MGAWRWFSIIPVVLFLSVGCRAASLPANGRERPVGFGAATTGACGTVSCGCQVTRLDDPRAATPGTLRYCAEAGGRWTLFKARGTVQLQRPLKVASNSTIDGVALAAGDAPVMISGSADWLVLVDGSDNVIIRNLFFRIPVRGSHCAAPTRPLDTKQCGLPLYLRGDARNVWIDHNDFDRCGEKCITVWTARDRDSAGRAEAPDKVTISNNRFTNSYFGVAIGSTAALSPNELPVTMRVTMYGNVFSNIFRRTPRAASNAQVHAFNNLIRHWGSSGRGCRGTDYGFGASSSGGAQVLLENNVFDPWPGPGSCKLAGETDEYDPTEGYNRGTGYMRGSGNLLLDGSQVQQTNPERVFNPGYAYALRPVSRLEADLERSAGVIGYPRPPLN